MFVPDQHFGRQDFFFLVHARTSIKKTKTLFREERAEVEVRLANVDIYTLCRTGEHKMLLEGSSV